MKIQTQEKSPTVASEPAVFSTSSPGIMQIENVFHIDSSRFFLPKPVVIGDATEEEAREGFTDGNAFAFWDDPCEDGYSLEDGDFPKE